ncbi:MAG: lytic murein transglycosylase [bacterium]|nr:lytic murein transglycosylase [bacterium]
MNKRPSTFVDIKSEKTHSFSKREDRVDLSLPLKRIPLRGAIKFLSVSLIVVYFIFGLVIAPNSADLFAASKAEDERAALEKELKELEAKSKELAAVRDQYRAQGNTLASEVNRLDAEIAALNNQIRIITLNLERLGTEIVETEGEIISTETSLEKSRKAVASALQFMYEKDQESLVAVLLKNPNLSDFFTEFNDLMDIQNTLRQRIKEMTELRNSLLEEKDLLSMQKEEVAALAIFQREQARAIASTKNVKGDLLEKTRGNEAAYQELLEDNEAKAAAIRKRIFTLLGGGEMSFEDAYNFAKYAQNLTGTRAAFLLAILDKESALGKYVGSCTYHTAMAPGPPTSKRDDVTPFLQITKELGLDPESTMVSCPISQDGAYGGAMGPSQFIPTTWMFYKDLVAKLTGNSPASPWRNEDAFVATALYIKDALNSCGQYSGTEQERCAAARYYAGGNWSRHLWTYGERVIQRAAQFEADIKIIQ